MTNLDHLLPYAYCYKETIYNTYDLAIKAVDLKGCFVECGVAGGAQIAAMNMALLVRDAMHKKVYAYDSFEGIPLGNDKDVSQPGIGKPEHDVNAPIEERLISSGVTVHNLTNVMDNLKKFTTIENIEFVRGWFQNTVMFHKEPIALLRLDGDLYESTLVCLEHLYPKVVKGGYVIIDDYALAGCYQAVQDYFGKQLPEMISVGGHKDNGVVYFQKK